MYCIEYNIRNSSKLKNVSAMNADFYIGINKSKGFFLMQHSKKFS